MVMPNLGAIVSNRWLAVVNTFLTAISGCFVGEAGPHAYHNGSMREFRQLHHEVLPQIVQLPS